MWPPCSGHLYRQRILSTSAGWFTLWVGFWLEEEGSAAPFAYVWELTSLHQEAGVTHLFCIAMTGKSWEKSRPSTNLPYNPLLPTALAVYSQMFTMGQS